MSWVPDGFQPDGWQPDSWQPEAGASSVNADVVFRFVRPRTLRRFVIGDGVRIRKEAMLEIRKTETEVYVIELDFARELEAVWQPGRKYSSADYCRPRIPNGFEYECTTAGETGSREPKWPKTAAAIVTSGSAVFTARAAAANARDTISSTNEESPAAITVGTIVTDGSELRFPISGGIDGGSYVISIEATTSANEVIEQKIRVDIIDE